MNCKYHIVLRDKNNALIDWRGYETLEQASKDFIALGTYFNTITDGDFVYVHRLNAFTNGSESITLCETDGKLLMEILFGSSRDTAEMFSNFFREKR